MKSTGFSSSYHSSSPSNSFTYVPDETALTLFKRVQLRGSIDKVEGSGIEIVRPLNNSPSLHIRTGINHIQEFKFNESVELQGYPSEVPEIVLNIALEFASSFENGLIIHISTGNNLFRALQQSAVDITSTPLYLLHQKGNVKSLVVQNMLHLVAAAEFLRHNLQGEIALVLIEEIYPLYLSQKNIIGHFTEPSKALSGIKSIISLSQYHSVLSFWVNSIIPKHLTKDPVLTLWRQKIPKLFVYNHSI